MRDIIRGADDNEGKMLLAADIGGTKTNLAIFSSEAGLRAPLEEARFPSADYPSLEALVREFLSQVDVKVERASFGVAGPVVAGRARITNLCVSRMRTVPTLTQGGRSNRWCTLPSGESGSNGIDREYWVVGIAY